MSLPFPAELPISAHVDEIAGALRAHQVVIVCGDTGSGKTTQLPKIALEAGRGRRGLIGCTQPRRLATVAMAQRVAEESGQDIGHIVGYQHRFESRLSQSTVVKFMTDGILLAEARYDKRFRKYDTLIIDEAHERSLNIDFLLGILKRILPRRPDLKIIISSATLDEKRFSAFFDGAPVVSVPGRLYPIETRWRPPADTDDPDLPRQIANAVDELTAEGEGDILVFLPGERDIREATETLTGRQLPDTEIIPLLASLPASEQQRAFRLSSNRRIILSTNVAETSVTLPGIRYVIDSGLARLNRYNPRTQVQRLQIEPISQASANQRKGRCGRIAPGICIRLYAADDFKKRDDYTPPEIQRSSLARVILTMMDLKLGSIETFPFIDPPGPALIKEGYRELDILDAIEKVVGSKPKDSAGAETAPGDHRGQAPAAEPAPPPAYRLTPLGREIASLPIDPAYARILFAAHREKALADTLTVVAALEGDDPRRRPLEKQAEADKSHARFLAPNSDFAAFVRLWRWWREQTAKSSRGAVRRLCKECFLSYPKMRDWADLREQLESACKALKLNVKSTSGGDEGLHRALLTGLILNLGQRDSEAGDYLGTHGARFTLFPGSGLLKYNDLIVLPNGKRVSREPRVSRGWVIAAELVETSRLFARTVACIDSTWIEPIAKRHCKYSYHSPQWDAESGFAKVQEHVTLFGIALSKGRTRDYSRINPEESRALMIREGLVGGAFPDPPPPFLVANLARARALLDAESKLRQHGNLFDPEAAFAFYDARLPQDICTAHALRKWIQAKSREQAAREQDPEQGTGGEGEGGWGGLVMSDADLPPPRDLAQAFPDAVTLNGNRLPLTYRHDPGDPGDGITCTVPPCLLPAAAAWRSDWLVPGMLDEKLIWMLNALPTKVRRLLQPYDETLAMCRSRMTPGRGPLPEAFAEALHAARGVRPPLEFWKEDDTPPHLRVRFSVVDEGGAEIGSGRNVDALARLFADQAAQRDTPAVTSPWHRDGLMRWDFGHLPPQVDVGTAGWPVIHYPALAEVQGGVSLRLFPDADAAAASHERGVCRLFALSLEGGGKRYQQLPSLPKAVTRYMAQLEMPPQQLGAEIGNAALRETFVEGKPVVRNAETFLVRLESERGRLHTVYATRLKLVTAILQAASEVDVLLTARSIQKETVDDVTDHLAWLVFPGFAETVPTARLRQMPRYLEAARIRILRAQTNPASDLRKHADVQLFWQPYVDFVANPSPPRHNKLLLDDYRWMMEEFRVSVFAQELRTSVTVSAKRLLALWDDAMKAR